MTAVDASQFAKGDDVYMLTDGKRVRCRVISVGAARMTVERLDTGTRSTRACTAFRKLTERDKWHEEEPRRVDGVLAYSSAVEIQPIAIRDRLDEVIAYLTAYSEWRRKEPKP